MRDTNAQRVLTMIPIGALHQPSEPHVSHAETGGFLEQDVITRASAAPC
jgi:hypothetical protein